MTHPDTETGCPSEHALHNLAALARFANPTRLPPYPRHRCLRLLQLAWGSMRIPHQRPWPEA